MKSQRGVTLIELMVALLLAMLLSVAILLIQRTLAFQNARTSDIALRDNEARAGMDLIAHDLSGAGFLFGGSQLPCDALLTYNSATTADFYARFPVDAIAASSGTAMPFTATLTLNYPVAAAGIASDVLVITAATGADNFSDATAPLVAVAPNAAYTPMTSGVLPLVSSTGVTAGHVALLKVPDSGKRACIRVPVTAIGAASGSVNVASSGALMPPNFYTGFAPQMAPNGLAGPLSNAELFQARLIDLGDPAAAATQTTTAFYIDGSANPWPTLMRATYSLLDDQIVGAPQPIAAGVVSLQLLFGVDPGNTGQVTAYETGAQLRTNVHQGAVLSIRVAMVTRALYADADFSNSAGTVPIAGGFASVPIPPAYSRHRYIVHQTEVALRNCRWQRC